MSDRVTFVDLEKSLRVGCRAWLPRVRGLRHTCAALLIAQGAHPKEVQERLGHSTIRLTFDRYAHLLPSLDERLRDALKPRTKPL